MNIGVFDSGFGGLTVLRALLEQIPQADYMYLGDTARLPYGAKSQATVARYAVSSARFLVEQGADYLVIACNTASALALDAIRDAVRVPVLGVIETGANAALASSKTSDVLVMATAATVESHAYRDACHERGLRAWEKACPLLVPLVEEGWIDHPVTEEVLRIYLNELAAESAAQQLTPDTLVLGCTHYPLLRRNIERAVPATIRVIDSADVTAAQVAAAIPAEALAGPKGDRIRLFYATDSVAKFRRLGAAFLGQPMDEVTLIDLGG
ncbi:glutamate racemase [Silvibacterium dinghuense]|uniref:Glutamate racemase n=1 Tax=Silvibacterium dinghuense TaxID=1560006 RepID=A0A4Q1SHW8_9BACT|nr:glutamate racemase [Silvibacterium dinghuense]RXS96967.1 glutamate racemase [Silvibacterium dinghuense]GGG95106.1 glutamate racemase [Silvibacterium dinghuense]